VTCKLICNSVIIIISDFCFHPVTMGSKPQHCIKLVQKHMHVTGLGFEAQCQRMETGQLTELMSHHSTIATMFMCPMDKLRHHLSYCEIIEWFLEQPWLLPVLCGWMNTSSLIWIVNVKLRGTVYGIKIQKQIYLGTHCISYEVSEVKLLGSADVM